MPRVWVLTPVNAETHLSSYCESFGTRLQLRFLGKYCLEKLHAWPALEELFPVPSLVASGVGFKIRQFKWSAMSCRWNPPSVMILQSFIQVLGHAFVELLVSKGSKHIYSERHLQLRRLER